jgi:hypothetical protein
MTIDSFTYELASLEWGELAPRATGRLVHLTGDCSCYEEHKHRIFVVVSAEVQASVDGKEDTLVLIESIGDGLADHWFGPMPARFVKCLPAPPGRWRGNPQKGPMPAPFS